MEKLSQDAIPGLIIANSGYVTRVTRPEQTAEQKEAWYPTTRDWPELITLNAGVVTRVGDKVIKI